MAVTLVEKLKLWLMTNSCNFFLMVTNTYYLPIYI